MKGFGIYVKNDLLDPKHYAAMERSVWLYLWFLDKMTSISEDGIGMVLSGRPIKHDDVKAELGISQSHYSKWITRLRKYGYINTTFVGNGLVITVNKATKIFGNKIKAIPKRNSSAIPKRNTSNTEKPQSGIAEASSGNSSLSTTIQKTEQEIPTTEVVDQKKVAEVMNAFKPINPHINFGNKTQRMAVVQMLSIHPFEKLLEIANFAVSNQGKPYAPTITTPYELRERMGALVVYAKKNNNKVIDLNV